MASLLVSNSPHIRSEEDIKAIMWTVVMMLVPAGLMGTVVFGWYAALLILVSIFTAVACEHLVNKIRKLPTTIGDGSAVLAGMLFAYVIPPNTSIFVTVLGSAATILLGKQLFGGLGCNIWNPALVGRAFVSAAYASVIFLSTWPRIRIDKTLGGDSGWLSERFAALQNSLAQIMGNINVDAVSQASPLSIVKGAAKALDANATTTVSELVKNNDISYMNLLTGHHVGCIGETSAGLLILGGLILIAMKIVDWRIPFFYIGTVALLSWIMPIGNVGWFHGDALFSVISGGLMIGAFFMATDFVTSPMTPLGKGIFAVGCGLLTVLIRNFGGFPEGVCYSILLMNTCVPLIDRFCTPRLFGVVKK
ncbi:MAG: RnfABCDGE type electron transport complex subunit D [Candidatus Brocadiia bacterium]